jgi:DNA-binding protein YbaB
MALDSFKKLGKLKKLRDRAVKMKKALSKEEVEIEEKGVKVVMDGTQKLKEVLINGEKNQNLVDVINKAIKKSQKMAAKKMQEIGGGLEGLGI